MKNKISLVGLLGLLGLLGLVNDNPGFYGFFGFFGFFGFSRIVPDELFRLNVNKAAKNAFFVGIFLYPVFAVLGEYWSVPVVYSWGFALNFAVQILVFTFSLMRYEKNGERVR